MRVTSTVNLLFGVTLVNAVNFHRKQSVSVGNGGKSSGLLNILDSVRIDDSSIQINSAGANAAGTKGFTKSKSTITQNVCNVGEKVIPKVFVITMVSLPTQ